MGKDIWKERKGGSVLLKMVMAKKVDGYKCGKCGNLFTGYNALEKAEKCCYTKDKSYIGTNFVDSYFKESKKLAERDIDYVNFKLEREDFYWRFLKDNPKIDKEDLSCRDYRIEWYCEHGVGHTIFAYNKGDIHSDDVHGCCHESCCRKLKLRGTKTCTKKAKK